MVGVIALWSVVPVLVKLLLPAIDPFTLAFLRLAQATLVVGAAFRLRGRRLAGIGWSPWHLVGGLGVTLNYALFALSLTFTTASAGVLVVQIQYVTLAGLAALLLGERLGAVKVAGMVMVLGGVVLVVSVRADVSELAAPRYAAGNALMLLAGVGWGVYAVSNKALSVRMGTLSILLPMLVLSTAITGGLSLTERWPVPTGGAWAQLLVLGVAATGGAFILVAEALKRLSSALTGTLTTVTPMLQIGLAHVLLDEPLSWSLGVGGGLIVGGVLAMVALERRGAGRPLPITNATPRLAAGEEMP
jgi:drug/metabolite transporter (DMT)-like permease